jgi:uncharacterized protein
MIGASLLNELVYGLRMTSSRTRDTLPERLRVSARVNSKMYVNQWTVKQSTLHDHNRSLACTTGGCELLGSLMRFSSVMSGGLLGLCTGVRLSVIALSALTLLFSLGIAAAQAQKRIALVIGNQDYKPAPKLDNAVNDATDVSAMFRAAGFDEVVPGYNLKFKEIHDLLKDFQARAASADIAVIFYAGHGMEIGGTNFVLPVDATLQSYQDAQYQAISISRLLDTLAGAKTLQLLILDSCRNNPFENMKLADQPGGKSRSTSGGAAPVNTATFPTHHTLVAYAQKAGLVAKDGEGRNSPFTRALLKHLTTPGLDVGMALRKVKSEVLRATASLQEPTTYGGLGEAEIALQPLKRAPSSTPQPPTPPPQQPTAGSPAVNDCDRLAGHPGDPQKVTKGVDYEKLDTAAAIAACGRALIAHPETARFEMQLGRAHYKARDYKTAFEWFEKASSQKSTMAMYFLARLIHYGEGVSKDTVKARDWYERAAGKGSPDAMVQLGDLFLNGDGVAQNFGKARIWFERSAQLGHSGSMYKLASMYYNGTGADKSIELAGNWYSKAAVAGLPDAMHMLGQMSENGQGMAADGAAARRWYEKAAATGHAESRYALGLLHHSGKHVQKNLDLALNWYEKAASAGNAEGAYRAGYFYEVGTTGVVDRDKAMKYYEAAAAKGHADAHKRLNQNKIQR